MARGPTLSHIDDLQINPETISRNIGMIRDTDGSVDQLQWVII